MFKISLKSVILILTMSAIVKSISARTQENPFSVDDDSEISNRDHFTVEPGAKLIKNIRIVHVKRRMRLFGVKNKNSGGHRAVKSRYSMRFFKRNRGFWGTVT